MSREQRRHARLIANLKCALATSESSYEGIMLNLALGGAAIVCDPGIAQVGDSLGVAIDRSFPDEPIFLNGEVVRIEQRPEQCVYALRFSTISPTDHAELIALLKVLAHERTEERRWFRRVAHRLEIHCQTGEEFRAHMRDLSHGGLGLDTPKPLTQGDEVSAVLSAPGFPNLITVKGTVMHMEPLEAGLFRAGIQFAPLTPKENAQLSALMDLLLGGEIPPAVLVEDEANEDEANEEDEDVIEGEVVE